MGLVRCEDRLIGAAAHDLRACFRAGKTVPDWVREDLEAVLAEIPEPVAEQLDLLRLQAERGDRLVVDLIEYFRAGQSKGSLEPIACDGLFKLASAKALPSDFTVQTSCECKYVTADGDAIERALDHVLQNAVKHHDAMYGTIWLTARKADQHVNLLIDDDGPGIPAEHQTRVFEPLVTLQSRDVREGSGLGLAIVNRLIGGMGGQVSAVDRPNGRGTRISIALPD